MDCSGRRLVRIRVPEVDFFFFFNDTATTEIYTLSLHDALPIFDMPALLSAYRDMATGWLDAKRAQVEDRKSTRLNSSHSSISYAVFCLKKKKKNRNIIQKPKTNQTDQK